MEDLLAILYRAVSKYSIHVEYGEHAEQGKKADRESITITTKEGKYKISIEKI